MNNSRSLALLTACFSLAHALAASALAAPILTSDVLLSGFYYPGPGISDAIWANRTISDGAATTVHEEVSDPGPFSAENQIYSGYRFDSDAFASASFLGGPVLKAFAQMDLGGAPFTPISAAHPRVTPNHVVQARASFSDDFVIPGPPGGSGRVKLTFGVSGFTSLLLRGQVGGSIAFVPPFTDPFLGATMTYQSSSAYNFRPFSGAGVFEVTDTFDFNTPKNFTLQLYAHVTSDYSTARAMHDAVFDFYGTQGRVDFSDTVVLTGLDITDLNGNPLANAQLVGSDGAVWRPVPEPSSTLLMLAGLAALSGIRRRKSL